MRDFIPAVFSATGRENYAIKDDDNLYNCVVRPLHNNEFGAHPRNEFTNTNLFTPSSSSNRGRGVTAFGGEIALYLDEDTYYYNGGSQDLTATTGNGYAGNTGFNEDYVASFKRHRVSGVENLVIVNAGHTSTNASAKHGNVWYVADGATAPSSVSDADMPGNNGVSITRGGASLDGYFFLCDINGQIHNSDLNDITAWTATNFLTAEREADIGVYLGKHHDNLVYIGTRSIEFFYNAGNANGSPLARRQDVSYQVGCYHPNSVVELGDVIYFVGFDQSGAISVYRIRNFQLEIVSDNLITDKLRSSSGISAGSEVDITDLDALDSQTWLSYAAPNTTTGVILTVNYQWTYFFDEAIGKWYRWSYDDTVTYNGGALWLLTFPICSCTGSSARARYQFINGVVAYENLTTDNDAMNDLGASNDPTVFTKFARWDAGTDKKKRISWVRVVTEPASSTNNSHDPLNVELRWADYDKAEVASISPFAGGYNTGRTIDLNTRGARVARLGTTRSRSFAIDWSTGHGPAGIVKGLEIEFEVVE